ncbi:MAG: gliding motility-associated C-terminal domain-containing protein [Bacteroidales bacterium]|nr:gliding motility-associated C-terminal domain-containing protein [Bacteroidales bacterium]
MNRTFFILIMLLVFYSNKIISQNYVESKRQKDYQEYLIKSNTSNTEKSPKAYTVNQTIGGDDILSSLKIDIAGDNLQVWRNIGSSTWEYQYFEYSSYPGRGVHLYADGEVYFVNPSETDFYVNGVAASGALSYFYAFGETAYDRIDIDQIDNYNATVKMTKTGIIEVLLTINYPAESDYINYQWEITNFSGSSMSDIRFFAGGDTYSYGSDNGIGYWEGSTNTLGCQKDDNGQTVSVFLQGLQTPFQHESAYYDDVHDHVLANALTGTVTTTTHDNSIALEWRKATLASGETWVINSIEKYSDKDITDLIVTAPLNETIAPGQTKSITFNVRNNSTNIVSDIILSEIIDLAGWSVNVTNPVSAFSLGVGANQDVTMEVTCPISATEGTIAQATLSATANTETANDKAYIEVVGSLPGISTQPSDQNVCSNSDAVSFSVSATNATGYQWQENSGSWSNISDGGVYSGSQSATLNISDVNGLVGNKYRCEISNSVGDITSDQAFIIGDNTDPVPDITNLVDIIGQCSISLSAPTATDYCSGIITATTSDPTTYNSQGTYTVTWDYEDDMGNTSSQNQTVIIDDVNAPVADVVTLSDITAECEVTSLTAPTATDNCEGTITGTSNVALPITITTSVVWTYEDGNGNISTQTQNVIINDVTVPVADAISLVDIIDECEVSSLIAPTATDNCAGIITGTTNISFPITISTTVIWTYEDENGNISTQNQNVIIDDVTAPVPDQSNLPDITEFCSVTISDIPSSTDNCEGNIDATTLNSLEYNTEGTYIITWTFVDNNGNSVSQNQTVIIVDSDPFVETQDITVYLDENGNVTITPQDIDNGSSDDCGIESMTLDITSFTAEDIGENTVNLTVTDYSGNSSSKSAIVTVIQPDFNLAIPNFISPNGDAKNDIWIIQGVEQLEGFSLNIFNKIGEIIYQSDNYKNTWDATFNGKLLPDGNYYYIFSNGIISYTGFISVVK